MKVKDIKNVRFTVLSSLIGYDGQHELNMTELFDMISRWKDKNTRLREVKDKEKRDKMKRDFPCWTPGGIFKRGSVTDKDIQSYSNVLAIDIDGKDNEGVNMEELKKQLFELPYVFLTSKSISGNGIYALMLVEDGHNNEDHFRAVERLWKKMFGVVVDEKCKNIGRKRCISYDENLMIKDDDVDILPFKPRRSITVTPTPTPIPVNYRKYALKSDPDKDKERTHKAMWKLLENGFNAKDYGYWYHVGCDFAAFEDGESMFNKLCDNYSINQDPKTKRDTWNECLKHPSPINEDMHRKWQGMVKNQLGGNWDNESIDFNFSVDQPPI